MSIGANSIDYQLGFNAGYAQAKAVMEHGHWIKRGDNSWECSVCHEISCCNGNYCVDCGAKMDGVEVCYDFLPYDSCTYGERKESENE